MTDGQQRAARIAAAFALATMALCMIPARGPHLLKDYPAARPIPPPPSVDSLAPILARCFGRPELVVRRIRWFVNDSSLGFDIAGRYYSADHAAVLRPETATNPFVVGHEIRHALADPEGRHPDSVFNKVCT